MRSFKVKTTPRWIILLLDMLIVLVSYASTVVADIYSTGTPGQSGTTLLVGLLVLLYYFIVTYISKSYTCVIRLSVIEDLYRIFMVVAISTVMLVLTDGIWLAFTGHSFIKFWNILVIGALSFSMMMIERLCIKYLYMRMNSTTTGRKRVLVLGTSFGSVFLAIPVKSAADAKWIGLRYAVNDSNKFSSGIASITCAKKDDGSRQVVPLGG